MSWQDRATRRGYDDTLLRSQVMPSNRRFSSHVTSSHFYLLTCNILTSWYFISKKNNWINWILIKTNIFDKSCISITSLIFILHLKYSILNQENTLLHIYLLTLRIYKFHHTDIDLCFFKIIPIWASKEFEENISRYLICEHF